MEYRSGDDQSYSGLMLAARLWGFGERPPISLRPLPHLLRLLYRACNLLKARMICDHQDVPSDVALRVKSLESLLVEKKIVDRATLDALIDVYEHKVGPRNGARVVARAWVDPAYKQRLLANGTAAIAELGYSGDQGADIRVVENTAKVPNLITCTL